jgi:ATP-dependent RNA helicase DHX29
MTTPQRLGPDTRHIEDQTVSFERNGNSLLDRGTSSNVNSTKTSKTLEYDSDIDPDELLPVYLKTKEKLFHLQPSKVSPQIDNKRSRDRGATGKTTMQKPQVLVDPEVTKLQRKLQKIENDVLFDQYIADQQWEKQRIVLEREAAAERTAKSGGPPERIPHPAEVLEEPDDEISREAARIAAEVLEEDQSDDDAAIAELFASLPVTEVDPVTGKSSVVVNSSDGKKITIRDFGKSTGITPRRVLEEACKAR